MNRFSPAQTRFALILALVVAGLILYRQLFPF